MTIGETIKINSPGIYKKLMQIGREKPNPNNIQLGDSAENLMKADSYKRVKGALKQITWG